MRDLYLILLDLKSSTSISIIIYLFTNSQHIKDHDEKEWYQSEEGCDIWQDALRGIHLVEDVAEAGRKENRWWAVKHEEGAESDDRRQLLQRRYVEKEYDAEDAQADETHQANQNDKIAEEVHRKRQAIHTKLVFRFNLKNILNDSLSQYIT